MPKPKYSIKDLKRRPETDPLPADIDEIPLSFARQFNSDELIVALQKMKANRWYGEVVYRDPKNENSATVFEFNSGILWQYKQVVKGKDVTVIRNVRNLKVG